MITNVSIKNYKSVVDVSLPLGRFNLQMVAASPTSLKGLLWEPLPVQTNWTTSISQIEAFVLLNHGLCCLHLKTLRQKL